MDTKFTWLINWEKVQTYEDLAEILRAYALSFESSGVTSRSGDFVDGHAKRAFLEELNKLADLSAKAKNWLYVHPTSEYSHNEGHHKNAE